MDDDIFAGLQFDCDSGMESLKIVKYIWGGGKFSFCLLVFGSFLPHNHSANTAGKYVRL